MATIKSIKAREILDSRGNPTVEVDVLTSEGKRARASAPSGASVGAHEVIELRDGDKKRYDGKGVLKAIENVNKKIAPVLVGQDVTKQKEIDQAMIDLDGTPNKSKLGANAVIATSIACAKAGALSTKLPLFEYLYNLFNQVYELAVPAYQLPVPMMNILNGGMHADNNVDIQEFMIVPVGAPSFREGIRMGAEVYHKLKETLKEKGLIVGVGDEGGFAPNLVSNIQAIEVITESIEKSGYKAGKDVCLAIDLAASYFFKNGLYVLTNNNVTLNSQEMIAFISSWIEDFPIISIEDGLAEDDWAAWVSLTEKLGNKIQIVGDDLFTTDLERLKKGIKDKCANAILIKPNQIGTVSETVETVKMAQKAGFGTVISHRSGETEDSFIADFSVACGAGQIKTGAPCRGERVAKYNQLMRIEEFLGNKGHYVSWDVFKRFI